MKVSLNIPPSLADRVKRAAEMRGLPVDAYIVALLQWHSPAYDNDAQYLKSKVRAALADNAENLSNALDAIADLVAQ